MLIDLETDTTGRRLEVNQLQEHREIAQGRQGGSTCPLKHGKTVEAPLPYNHESCTWGATHLKGQSPQQVCFLDFSVTKSDVVLHQEVRTALRPPQSGAPTSCRVFPA
jgi:hypothetical protein